LVDEDKEEAEEEGFKEAESREAGVIDPEVGEEDSEEVNREVEVGTDLITMRIVMVVVVS